MRLNRKTVLRFLAYFAGLLILAIGITLNTKTSLGVSPIISVAYSVSQITGINFGNTTFLWYVTFVLVEIIIHIILKRYKTIPFDLLQIVLSLVFTRFMNIFDRAIPNMVTDMMGTIWATMPVRIIVLLIAIILTGIGAAMSLNVRLIPNPGDGICQAISDLTGKKVGFVKNCVDITCVCTTCVVSMLFAGKLIGVGIGTVMAMIGVGRVVAVFNHFTLDKFKLLIQVD